MSAEADYLHAERENLFQTLHLIDALVKQEVRSQYETIALGKPLQDLYTGLERIVRALVEDAGIHVGKTESWHKDLLLAARKHSLVGESQFEAFGRLLLFRHVQVHGYGFLLRDERLVDTARSVTEVCHSLLRPLA